MSINILFFINEHEYIYYLFVLIIFYIVSSTIISLCIY